MKLIAPLWRDPVGWAEGVARTKLRVFIWTLVHICFVASGIIAIHWLVQKLPAGSEGIWFAVTVGAGPMVFIGVVYPAMYLYAMHRLLKILRASPKQ